eukprot:365053-Chlamydomonas_euryale.AAC.15
MSMRFQDQEPPPRAHARSPRTQSSGPCVARSRPQPRAACSWCFFGSRGCSRCRASTGVFSSRCCRWRSSTPWATCPHASASARWRSASRTSSRCGARCRERGGRAGGEGALAAATPESPACLGCAATTGGCNGRAGPSTDMCEASARTAPRSPGCPAPCHYMHPSIHHDLELLLYQQEYRQEYRQEKQPLLIHTHASTQSDSKAPPPSPPHTCFDSNALQPPTH